jgi:hypothetical protein
VSFIRDVTTSDPIGYFSRQPRQMLVVAAIAVATALMMAGFHKLPPLWRRRVYLLVLAMAASIMTVAIGWAGFLFFVCHIFGRPLIFDWDWSLCYSVRPFLPCCGLSSTTYIGNRLFE